MVIFLALIGFVSIRVVERLSTPRRGSDPRRDGPGRASSTQMVRRRIWIVGFGVMALGYLVQSIALHLGSVAGCSAADGERTPGRGLRYCGSGTPRPGARATWSRSSWPRSRAWSVFLAVASPSEGTRSPHAARWIITSVLIAALAAASSRSGCAVPIGGARCSWEQARRWVLPSWPS